MSNISAQDTQHPESHSTFNTSAEPLEHDKHAIAHTVDTHVELAKEVGDKVQTSFDFLATLRMLGHGLNTLAHILPPLRLALEVLSTGWNILRSIFISKDSKLSTAARITFAVLILGLAIGAIAAPAVAGILYAVSAGLTLFKDIGSTAQAWRKYRQLDQALKIAQSSLVQAEESGEKPQIASIKVQIEQLQREKALAKSNRQEHGLNTLLGMAVIAGLILALFPPTTMLGLSIILGTSAVGVVAKVAPKIFLGLRAKPLISATAAQSQSTTTEKKSAPELGLFNWFKSQLRSQVEVAPLHDSTLTMAAALNEKPGDQKTLIEELHKASQHQEIHLASKTPQVAGLTPSAHTVMIAAENKNAGAKENEDENEGEGEGNGENSPSIKL